MAASIFQRIGQDRQAIESAVGVDRFGQGDDVGRAPTGINGDWAEGVAEYVAESICLDSPGLPMGRKVDSPEWVPW